MSDPTQQHCPALPEGDNATHHMMPSRIRSQAGTFVMVCRNCHKTSDELIADDPPATTPVVDTSSEALLKRAWKVHQDSEDLITQHSLRLLAGILKEVISEHPVKPTGRVKLTWEEMPSWAVEVETTAGPEWVDVYDMDEAATDELAEYDAHFWETSPSLLSPYTETSEVEVDKTFGMLEEAVFLLDRIAMGPRDDETQRVMEAAAAEHARTGQPFVQPLPVLSSWSPLHSPPCPDCGAPLDVTPTGETCTNVSCTYSI